jgi:hypothetical protein
MHPPLPFDGQDVSETVPPGMKPASERDQDMGREDVSEDLAKGEEVEAFENEDSRVATDSRVSPDDVVILDTYAPASERVPKQPTPGDREYLETHMDMSTPERLHSRDSAER